jgi:anti-sigma regulatory factor (Ser/Thr protein kinase)
VNGYQPPAPPISGGSGGATRHQTPEPSSTAATAHHTSHLELAPLPTAVSCARLHTVTVLNEWGLPALADDAALIVSELMTNALEASHALDSRPPITLHLSADTDRLVIEAWDQSPADPEIPHADTDSEAGRGLMIVAALADRWGAHRGWHNRKAVWAELALPSGQR